MNERRDAPAAAAIEYAFERGLIKPPTEGTLWMCLNAAPLPALKHSLVCQQGFRPDYNRLEASGFETVPEFDDSIDSMDGAIVFAGRSVPVNRNNLVIAWNRLRPGGAIIVAGEKKAGISSLRKWADARMKVAGRFSKHHAQIFWAQRQGFELEKVNLRHMADGYQTADGMFSSREADSGSQLLAELFDKRISGKVADFGSGWGYLGAKLLAMGARIDLLDSYEADWASLNAARRNLSPLAGEATLGFHWLDVTEEQTATGYDWVVMNPPFHAGRAADPAIGRQFIVKAAAALRKGGHLLMVANRNLPYEKTIADIFGGMKPLGERNGYKLIEAVRN